MKMRLVMTSGLGFVVFPILLFFSHWGLAADKLIGFHSARTMSQSMPWIAEEAGPFRKYALDFQLVYISSAPFVTAALLGGHGHGAIISGAATIRASASGAAGLP